MALPSFHFLHRSTHTICRYAQRQNSESQKRTKELMNACQTSEPVGLKRRQREELRLNLVYGPSNLTPRGRSPWVAWTIRETVRICAFSAAAVERVLCSLPPHLN
ncbi:hypothetical protein SAY86_020283 [Trapa natans]|uniref:Uncharacterized protein n=1 Tax=Trapa natans TaxID=22666 RepID=A0AAN7LPJ8_TRANT|nr:hypothetical protein SAY86_020283 [Trapa natans]